MSALGRLGPSEVSFYFKKTLHFYIFQHITHFFFIIFLARSGSRATKTASEKTALTPSRDLAEHSMYPDALMF